jgi:multimeric flavodoxin WrbA
LRRQTIFGDRISFRVEYIERNRKDWPGGTRIRPGERRRLSSLSQIDRTEVRVRVLVVTCSPNKDGLTEACGEAAKLGVLSGGGETISIRLNDRKLSSCKACKDGWGSCAKGVCQVKDGFQMLHREFREADAFVVVTPVYWWDMSESAKALFDRLRRCEAMKESNRVKGKPFLCVAAAGGTGYGTINCLASMERMFLQLNDLQHFDLASAMCDFIGVTRKNRIYMLEAIRAAAENLVTTGLGDPKQAEERA